MRSLILLGISILLISCSANNYYQNKPRFSTSSVQGSTAASLVHRYGEPDEKISQGNSTWYVYRSLVRQPALPIPPSVGIDQNGNAIVVNNPATVAQTSTLACEIIYNISAENAVIGESKNGACS